MFFTSATNINKVIIDNAVAHCLSVVSWKTVGVLGGSPKAEVCEYDGKLNISGFCFFPFSDGLLLGQKKTSEYVMLASGAFFTIF